MALTDKEEFELLSLERERSAGAAPAGDAPLFSVTRQNVSDVARPVLEMGGGLGGAALAGAGSLPLGPVSVPAAAAGGALGFGAGRAAANLLDRGLGLKPQISSLKDAAGEVAGNVGAGLGMEAGGAVLNKAAGLIKPIGKGLISVLFGPPLKDVEARAVNNAAIKAAQPFDVLARQLPEDFKALAKDVSDKSTAALKTLSTSKYIESTQNQVFLKIGESATPINSVEDAATKWAAVRNKAMAEGLGSSDLAAAPALVDEAGNQIGRVSWNGKVWAGAPGGKRVPLEVLPEGDAGGAFTKAEVLGPVKAELKGMGRTISDATGKAKDALARYTQRLSKLGPTVSQNEIGSIVRDIDNDINWDDKEAAPLNNALEGIRTKLDTLLKAKNPEYGAAMEPVAEGTRILKKGQQVFRLERVPGEGFKPTNTTASTLKSAISDTRVDSQDVFKALEAVTGRNWGQAAENAATAESFKAGAGRSASHGLSAPMAVSAGAGGLAGSLLGGAPGAAAGGVAGALTGKYLDQSGPPLAATLIDKLVALSRQMGPMPSQGLARVIAAAMASKYGKGAQR